MPINRGGIGSTRHCGDVGESSGTSGPSGAAVRPGQAALVGGEPAQGELSFAPPDDHHQPAQLPACEKPQALEALRARHDETCPHCTQATAHTRTVFGEGNADAELMVWAVSPTLEAIQQFNTQLAQTELGTYLETSHSYLAMTRRRTGSTSMNPTSSGSVTLVRTLCSASIRSPRNSTFTPCHTTRATCVRSSVAPARYGVRNRRPTNWY
ncbi:MAG: chlorite dismutase family protein [Acidobacteria bacterium]|nr:chlorite dismutase family protein [Acidobacteriota bacterium]